MLKKIECYVSPKRIDEMKSALIEKGVDAMTISEVKGFGRQQERILREKGPSFVPFETRIKIEIFIEEERLDVVTTELRRLARTGASGAGMIFILPVEEAIRLSTEEAGELAMR